ncbi:MAG: aldehyde dehydrogenase family protein [Alicyclobacillus sp.]|nr:aldehyde dehydrogenase family protein [Alicyclobacillus sp.]
MYEVSDRMGRSHAASMLRLSITCQPMAAIHAKEAGRSPLPRSAGQRLDDDPYGALTGEAARPLAAGAPVFADPAGQPVAFLGRAAPTAGPDTPKYINSTDTPIYRKRQMLYGLAEQNGPTSAGLTPLLVEGPTDVLATWLHQPQLGYLGLAACGTSLTEQHAATLAALPAARQNGIVTAFDADPAGQHATLRAFQLLSVHTRLTLSAAVLPTGTDPADLAHHDATVLHAALTNRRPLAQAAVDITLDQYLAARPDALTYIEGRHNAIHTVAALIVDLPAAQITDLVDHIAQRTRSRLDTVAEIIERTGLPAGAVSILPMTRELGDRLVADPRFKLLTFTGSPSVGWRMKERAGKKKVVLELGGNAGVIVDASADLDWAVKRILVGAFTYAGQVCISVQRIFASQRVFDPFTERFVRSAESLVVGDPLDERVDVGPMIDEREAIRIEAWVDEARAAGAKVATGGRRAGPVYWPTVLTDVTPQMRVVSHEAFAPVASVMPYADFEAALQAADATPYGLQAAVFTKDLDRLFQALRRLNFGGIIINDAPTFRVDHMPYGGTRQSGLGREGVRFAIEEMTNIQMVVIRTHG